MPTPEPIHAEEKERDKERERDRDTERGDRGGPKQKSSSSAASKTKDLSHVPCKFYKVGGCTAGSSCPFSHTAVEPGAQKETCAWFVKGTCKFGHKCALAHLLPGQPMSMDRKNKKAAQLANQAANATTERGEKPNKDAKAGRNQRREGNSTGASNANRNALLGTGATAPTRMLSSGSSASSARPPMMKTALSPSVPAPPVASLGVIDDLDAGLPTAPAQGKTGPQEGANATTSAEGHSFAINTTSAASDQSKPTSPGTLPTSAPRSATTPTKPKHDFGPIGSPPAVSSLTSRPNHIGTPGTSPQRINGVSGSPGANFIPSSPFSAPHANSGFMSGSYNGAGGIASSLNALSIMNRRGWAGKGGEGAGPPRPNGGNRVFDFDDFGTQRGITVESAVDDGDLEDFLPSSLNDLLTPEERTRRMSRSNSGQPTVPATAALGVGAAASGFAAAAGGDRDLNNNAAGLGHRYSHSVPAPSLLGDIKSIWADNSTIPTSPPAHRTTPSSSFTARFDPLSANHGNEDMALSMSLGSAGSGMMSLSPSNASAAFLPGLHSHYLNSKAKQAQQAQQLGLGMGGVGRSGLRNPSAPLYGGNPNANSGFSSNTALLSGTPPSTSIHTHINPHTNTAHTYRATPSPFDLTQQHHQHHLHPQTARPIPSQLSSAGPGTNAGKNGLGIGPGAMADDPHAGTHLLSPSTRALQAHAPGQSLPQGLAAGYSRIHALPPPPSIGSPSGASFGTSPGFGGDLLSGKGMAEGGGAGSNGGSGAGSTPTGGVPGSGPYGQWKGPSSPPASAGATSGLEGMFSRLSYSAAAASRTGGAGAPTGATGGNGTGPGVGSPPGLTRNVSGSRYTQPLSPLSGPVVTSTNDDDDLFSMDG